MQADIRNTVTAALTARDTITATIHNAAHELEQLDTQPVVVALARLSDAIDSVHSTLGMLRARAAGILSAGAGLFAEFAVDVVAQVEQPQVEPVSEPAPAMCEICNDVGDSVRERGDGLQKCEPCQIAHDVLADEMGDASAQHATGDIVAARSEGYVGEVAEILAQSAANEPASDSVPAHEATPPARKGRNRKAKK